MSWWGKTEDLTLKQLADLFKKELEELKTNSPTSKIKDLLEVERKAALNYDKVVLNGRTREQEDRFLEAVDVIGRSLASIGGALEKLARAKEAEVVALVEEVRAAKLAKKV